MVLSIKETHRYKEEVFSFTPRKTIKKKEGMTDFDLAFFHKDQSLNFFLEKSMISNFGACFTNCSSRQCWVSELSKKLRICNIGNGAKMQ
jgi:hypothetical protein